MSAAGLFYAFLCALAWRLLGCQDCLLFFSHAQHVYIYAQTGSNCSVSSTAPACAPDSVLIGQDLRRG
eukprot:scaffold651150_cov51-Prasinocladus_malaysianus.AAC.1